MKKLLTQMTALALCAASLLALLAGCGPQNGGEPTPTPADATPTQEVAQVPDRGKPDRSGLIAGEQMNRQAQDPVCIPVGDQPLVRFTRGGIQFLQDVSVGIADKEKAAPLHRKTCGVVVKDGQFIGKGDFADARAYIVDGAEQIAQVIGSTYEASPFCEKFVLEAACVMGRTDLALKRMRERYDGMLHDQYDTLWEYMDSLDGTINHGWTAAPIYILSKYIAGVRSPGYAPPPPVMRPTRSPPAATWTTSPATSGP